MQIVYDDRASGRRLILLDEDLPQLGMTPATALRAAVQNLETISSGPLERMPSGLLVASWRDDYAASRLLLPDLCRRAAVRGELLAMVLTPRELLLAGTEDQVAACGERSARRMRPRQPGNSAGCDS